MRRVVVTGMGIVSCLGNDVETVWQGLLAGRSGIAPMTRWNPDGLRNPRMGEVKDFPWDDEHDEATQFALYAAGRALNDAGLSCSENGDSPGGNRVNHPVTAVRGTVPIFARIGLVSSTNFGGASAWDQYLACLRAGAVNAETAELFTEFTFSRTAALIRERHGLAGPARVLSLSCSSGTAAIGQGLDLIRLGKADAVLCEGHDSLAVPSLAGLSILRTITAEELRPFDARRSGTIFGEGCGALVLESLERAEARGAAIYGEVLGYAVNNNAYHLTAPDKAGDGIVAVLRAALRDAGVTGDAVDYVNAHGTGTAYFDVTETTAVKTVLGDRAYRIPISSIKPAIGHMMAAAGSAEAIATLCALRDGIIPPTLNHEQPDPDCDLDYVPGRARRQPIRTALSISSGIGGNNAAVVLRRWDDTSSS
ncbi:MAG TPA: beta-ketoacyl-[acyl-carrier-protein] synthase family protein [Armatimonadota bacterium]|nr:beta-ketoacyl-[acyl-carrier-protein] synthase family protein [Armatimonadota bacterium]HOS43796.1 beta-ketoacyl-[acyl-carrier-protein] synthase family protein [Armatimonadota bacterium]